MKYNKIVEGLFIRRINRFIAEVKIGNEITKVHVKNTGRCKELFIEGTKVYLEESDNINRKTKYSLISIYKEDMLINIDSQVPNKVVYDALIAGKIQEIGKVDYVKREVPYGDSRIDLYFEKEGQKGLIEVKGVTLEKDGLAMFPDAPTERGRRHIYELIKAKEQNYLAYIFFLIQMENISKMTTNSETDLKFSQAVKEAYEKGINILVYNCFVKDTSIELNKQCNFLIK